MLRASPFPPTHPAGVAPQDNVARRARRCTIDPASVLVIEDNPGDAVLIRSYLEAAGMSVLAVETLGDAEHALGAGTFDFVLSDLMLPDARGLEAILRLRDATGGAPLIVLSGLDDEDVALQAVQAGAEDYLIKGQINVPMLRRTLRHARERRQLVNQLTHLTRHDVLTGAANRVALGEQLEAAIGRDGAFALMYVDLDHFKEINDTLGHAAGDAVLREVVVRLQASVRAADVVARLGGDEFAVLINNVASRTGLVEIAERILEGIRQPIPVPGGTAAVTSSIGIACYPEAATPDRLIKAADTAMYHAKRRGRNALLLASEVEASDQGEARLARDLRNALGRDEFQLHFQPQFSAADQRLIGFEALLRWHRPGRPDSGTELVPPSRFIPLLEADGGIVEVGQWVIARACQQLAAWRDARHPELRIAVNVSAQQFSSKGLVPWTRRCLEEFTIPPGCLELEITETNLMADTTTTAAVLAELRGIGVRVAIDDFGTGFSSLAYLSRFTVDVLKIDRSLIERVGVAPDAAAITRSIVALAHELRIAVVAEGVETDVQLAGIRDARCDVVQGYLWGRPAAAASLDGSEVWDRLRPPVPQTIRLRRIR